MVTTITPVMFLAQETHHSASCLASTQLVHEGEEVTNAEHKKRLKETSGIGTVATRAAIIEELKAERYQYLSLKGKYLHCTAKGLHIDFCGLRL